MKQNAMNENVEVHSIKRLFDLGRCRKVFITKGINNFFIARLLSILNYVISSIYIYFLLSLNKMAVISYSKIIPYPNISLTAYCSDLVPGSLVVQKQVL